MGGQGSGRPSGWGRNQVEEFRSFDVNRLHREGCLQPGWVGGWHWAKGGEKVAAIAFWAERDRLHLAYRVRMSGGKWQNVAESVGITHVACRFGGTRPYFVCPGKPNGSTCGRRVGKLYAAGRRFLCRRCYELSYASQRETELQRMRRKVTKACKRLGSDSSTGPFVPKPKGMRQHTFERLRRRAFDLQWQADEEVDRQCGLLLTRIEKKERRENRA